MDHDELVRRERQCCQEEAPACVSSCPAHVDVRAMTAAVARGDFAAGLDVLGKGVPFPGIISRICDRPCERFCRRGEAGGPIEIRALERACYDEAALPAPKPPGARTGKVAIVGAGLSGLAAAHDLARKGRSVTVYEAGWELGGRVARLPESMLPSAIRIADLAVIERLGVELRLGAAVGDTPSTSITMKFLRTEYDAIYLAPGATSVAELGLDLELDREGRVVLDPVSFATSDPKTFAGGGHRRRAGDESPIASVADGRRAAISIGRLLGGSSLTQSREREGPYASSLHTGMKGIDPRAPVAPRRPESGYAPDEAVAEAGRCLRCECMECVKVCAYLEKFKSYPKRYVREVYNNLAIVKGLRHANSLIDSCSLCGLCREVCPGDLDMGEVNLRARRTMVERGKMPPSAFGFALEDFAFSASGAFFLAENEPGHETSRHLFFPGCQLCASLPDHVAATYAALRERLPGGVGLILGCCGAPADWAGESGLHRSHLGVIEAAWRRMGEPRIVAACPTCVKQLREGLSGARIDDLWSALEEVGLPSAELPPREERLALHDACTARLDPALQKSARRAIARLGYRIEELETSRDTSECCGYGGLMYDADPALANEVARRRGARSERDFVVYCAMCRDRLATQGKNSVHILELLFGAAGDRARKGPGLSERRANRARLKERLLRDIWGETMSETEKRPELRVPDEVLRVMEDRFILDDDLRAVLARAEASGERFLEPESGLFVASAKSGNVTYWVWYSVEGEGFVIRNAYSHRMDILG